MNFFRALWEAFCETAKEEFTVTEQDRQRLAAQRQAARKRQNEEDNVQKTDICGPDDGSYEWYLWNKD